MLDVHAPHGKLLGFKDFFLHLLTIIIGLLIALGLEGWVEYQHHRHLAHQAGDGLRAEIAQNSHEIGPMRQQIIEHQKQLEANLKVLAEMQAHPHAKIGGMPFGAGYKILADVSWKTAQNTGALTYMSYEDAQNFSNIYLEQDGYSSAGRILTEDIGNAVSLLISHPDNWVPSPAQIDVEADRIGKAQFDLTVLMSSVDNLDNTYKKFESEHK